MVPHYPRVGIWVDNVVSKFRLKLVVTVDNIHFWTTILHYWICCEQHCCPCCWLVCSTTSCCQASFWFVNKLERYLYMCVPVTLELSMIFTCAHQFFGTRPCVEPLWCRTFHQIATEPWIWSNSLYVMHLQFIYIYWYNIYNTGQMMSCSMATSIGVSSYNSIHSPSANVSGDIKNVNSLSLEGSKSRYLLRRESRASSSCVFSKLERLVPNWIRFV